MKNGTPIDLGKLKYIEETTTQPDLSTITRRSYILEREVPAGFTVEPTYLKTNLDKASVVISFELDQCSWGESRHPNCIKTSSMPPNIRDDIAKWRNDLEDGAKNNCKEGTGTLVPNTNKAVLGLTLSYP